MSKVIGIDLGTTNSLVATVRSAEAQTLPDENGHHILPSVVRYGEHGIEVGDAALEHAVKDPSNTIVSVKRLMGRAAGDLKSFGERSPYEFSASESSVPKIKTRSGDVSATEISAEILKVLKNRAVNITIFCFFITNSIYFIIFFKMVSLIIF